jgi:hypothetical protein
MIGGGARPSLVAIGHTKEERMTLSPHTAQRVGRSIACAAAVAAIAVPLAQASGSQDRYGPLDPWAYRLVHQANKYGPLDPWAYNVIRRNSLAAQEAATERSAPRNGSTNGFDWADAAVGAGGALGLMLVAAGAINTVRRARGGVAEVGS